MATLESTRVGFGITDISVGDDEEEDSLWVSVRLTLCT